MKVHQARETTEVRKRVVVQVDAKPQRSWTLLKLLRPDSFVWQLLSRAFGTVVARTLRMREVQGSIP